MLENGGNYLKDPVNTQENQRVSNKDYRRFIQRVHPEDKASEFCLAPSTQFLLAALSLNPSPKAGCTYPIIWPKEW